MRETDEVNAAVGKATGSGEAICERVEVRDKHLYSPPGAPSQVYG